MLGGCATVGGDAPGTPVYVPGTGYHMLMAELSAERGIQPVAAEEYLRAAEHSDSPAESQRATAFAFEYGFDAWALRAARRWAALAPDEASARLHLARLLVRRNDIEGAAAQAAAALGPAAPRSEEDYRLLAGELAQEDNPEGVTRVWTRLAARAPPTPALQTAVAGAALRSGDLELALAAAHSAIDPDIAWPGEDEAQTVIGRALLARGQTDAALAYAREQAAARPEAGTAIEYASLLAAADRSGEALAVLADLESRQGEEPAARRLRGLMSLDAGDDQAAWEQFSGLASNDEYGGEACFRLAGIALRQQQLETAVQMLARVDEGPWLLPARDALAHIAVARGDLPTALQLLEVLALQHPELAFQAARRRAAILQQEGAWQRALDVLDGIVRFQPDDAQLRLTRGALLEQMGRIGPALADMAAAAALMPDNALVLNAYGYTLANRSSRRAEAYGLIRRALERRPDDPAILDSYGWVLYRQGRLALARSYLELAHARLADPEVAAHLGEVMWKQGEHERARRLWEDALQASPTSQPLLDTLARFPR